MLSQSFIDNSKQSDFLSEDRVLFDLFERALEHGRITEFVNLQTGERVDNRYILEQVSEAVGYLSRVKAVHPLLNRLSALILYVGA